MGDRRVKTALTLVSKAIDEPISISKDSSTFIDQLDELLQPQPGTARSFNDMIELEKKLKILIYKADQTRVQDVQGRLERQRKLLDKQESDQNDEIRVEKKAENEDRVKYKEEKDEKVSSEEPSVAIQTQEATNGDRDPVEQKLEETPNEPNVQMEKFQLPQLNEKINESQQDTVGTLEDIIEEPIKIEEQEPHCKELSLESNIQFEELSSAQIYEENEGQIKHESKEDNTNEMEIITVDNDKRAARSEEAPINLLEPVQQDERQNNNASMMPENMPAISATAGGDVIEMADSRMKETNHIKNEKDETQGEKLNNEGKNPDKKPVIPAGEQSKSKRSCCNLM